MIRYVDLRALETGEDARALDRLTAEVRSGEEKLGVYLTAWQAAALEPLLRNSPLETVVTVPDFLNYARLLNTGQAAAMLRLSGSLVRSALAGLQSAPALAAHPVRAAQTDFWLVAEVLLRYDLALLPSAFRGPVLLHSYLADFAFLFERRDFVSGFFRRAGAERAGISTQQVPLALSCLSRWGLRPALFSFLLSPGDGDGRAALLCAQSGGAYPGSRFIAEIESLPSDLQSQETPASWNTRFDGFLASGREGLLHSPPPNL